MVSHCVLFVFVLSAVACLQFVFAAPNPNPSALKERENLVQEFAEFLHEDPEFSAALDKISWNEDHLVRNRRQASGPGTQEIDDSYDQPNEKPGFFDRAAKFVTELLQRFLKWINNSDNN
ncbi:hypothetical protein ILUMI_07631 [Ignelater luminosus]|uniref:Uncharacterized protein n=1 Tax=Ignelater luminosus TaxID=2038154 RepID=A0A8K0GBF4_IGNLU|nr:hypothetical protein ILUMI_07631 [Ignelater luminosus]